MNGVHLSPHPTATADAAELQAVTRRYPSDRGPRRPDRPGAQSRTRIALDGVDLRIGASQWVSLLGPNGSGKSTLLRILATLDTQYDGTARVLGRDPREPSGRAWIRPRLGMVFQSPSLDPLLSVGETLELQGALYGLEPGSRRARATELAERLGVSDRLGERVGSLSGGLARRVDLARALVAEPELLLLDEPTTGLDHGARASFMDLLCAMHERRGASQYAGTTIVHSTHLMDEAEAGDRVVMLHEGRVVADAAPSALRDELGAWVVACWDRTGAANRDGGDASGAQAALAACGLTPRPSGPGKAYALLDRAPEPDLIRTVAARLGEAGLGFSLDRATLADVYMARTGESLSGSGREEMP